MVTECGVPAIIKSDNAPEFKSAKWTSFLRSHCIRSQFTEAYHPNQNLAERRGGTLKAATIHLITVTQAPKEYWCYALEFIALVRSCVAKRSLNWKTPHELHFGDTPDISVFRFVFWQPIWYYSPTGSFPNPRMLKGRFLGISPNVGDAFCFRVLTEPDDPSTDAPVVIARSVIRARTEVHQSARMILRNMTESNTRINAGYDAALDFRALTNSHGDEPPTSVAEEDDTQFVDTSTTMQQLHNQLTQDGTTSSDPFQNGFLEVFGPQPTSPSIPAAEVPELVAPIPTSPDHIPQTDHTISQTPTVVMASDSNNVTEQITTSDNFEHVTFASDSVTPDSVIVSPMTDPSPNVLPEVTQDEDEEEMAVQEEVASFIVEDVNDDDANFDQFASIVSHQWSDGILQFEVQWKTQEKSFLPFLYLSVIILKL